MKQVVLDTDILSYVLENRYSEVDAYAKQYLRVFGYFSISVITMCEVIEGFEASQDNAAATVFHTQIETFEILLWKPKKRFLQDRFLGH